MAQSKKGKGPAPTKSAPEKKTPVTKPQVKGKGNKQHVPDESSSNNDSDSSSDTPSHQKWKPHKRRKHVKPEEHEDEERIMKPEYVVVDESSGDEPEEGNKEVCHDIPA